MNSRLILMRRRHRTPLIKRRPTMSRHHAEYHQRHHQHDHDHNRPYP
jgi:hypothetical protein